MQTTIPDFLRKFLWIAALLIAFPPLHADGFRAGVAKKDITPKDSQQLLGYQARKSTGIHNPIYHRIVVLDDGKSRFYLVSSDICLISPSEYERVKGMVMEKFGISGNQFWWSVTHTHSAPEVGPPGLAEVFLGNRYEHEFDQAYTDFVAEAILQGISEAQENLRPATLAVGEGESRANMNRRAKTVDGRARLGMDPDGPMDRRVGVFRLSDQATGQAIADIANYAMHGTVLGSENLLISGDAPGVVAEYVEEQTGVPMLYINGAAGNLAPIYSVYPSPQAGHLEEFKRLLGQRILETIEGLPAPEEKIQLEFGSLTIHTPRKEGLGWTDDLVNYTAKTATGKDEVLLPIQFLKLNERIGIWSAPLELFCEISSQIQQQSPFPLTFYFGYTNGWLGYLLTAEEWKFGGYEPRVSPFTPEAETHLVEKVTTYLREELRK